MLCNSKGGISSDSGYKSMRMNNTRTFGFEKRNLPVILQNDHGEILYVCKKKENQKNEILIPKALTEISRPCF